MGRDPATGADIVGRKPTTLTDSSWRPRDQAPLWKPSIPAPARLGFSDPEAALLRGRVVRGWSHHRPDPMASRAYARHGLLGGIVGVRSRAAFLDAAALCLFVTHL